MKYEAQHYKKELSRAKSILEKSNQLLIVTSKDWDSTTASLTCYERRKGKLLKIGESIPVNLGRFGLGWGMGLVEFDTQNAPVKNREGQIIGALESVTDVKDMKEMQNYLTRSTQNILQAMVKFSNSDLTVSVNPEKEGDDIAELFVGFNHSVQNIKSIIVNVMEAVQATASASRGEKSFNGNRSRFCVFRSRSLSCGFISLLFCC